MTSIIVSVFIIKTRPLALFHYYHRLSFYDGQMAVARAEEWKKRRGEWRVISLVSRLANQTVSEEMNEAAGSDSFSGCRRCFSYQNTKKDNELETRLNP